MMTNDDNLYNDDNNYINIIISDNNTFQMVDDVIYNLLTDE